MKNSSSLKAAWVSPTLAVHGKVEEITQDTWKAPGLGDGVVICIDDSAITVDSCAPGSC